MMNSEIRLYWRNKSYSRRQKLIDEHGVDWVRNQEKEKKRQQRLKKKAKVKEDSDIDEFASKLSKQSLNKSQEVKKETLKQYVRKIRTIHKLIFNKEIDLNDMNWLKDVDMINKFITEYYGSQNTTATSYQIAITAITGRLDGFEEAHKKSNQAMMQLSKNDNKRQGNNKLSDKELINYIPWNEVLKIAPKTNQSILIYTLYTSLPPRRNEDYKLMRIKFGNIKIEELSNEYNYYLKDMKKLVFKRYKTDKVFKTQIIDLKNKNTEYIKYSEVKRAFKLYLNECNFNDNDILFPSSSNGFRSNWTSTIKKIFTYGKKKLGTQLLRHSYITWFLKKNPNVNVQKNIATMMAHSISTQMMYKKIENDMTLIFDN